MSATRARQGGQVHLEQFKMPLAMNVHKMGKGGFSSTQIEEMQHVFKTHWTDV